MKAIKIKTAKGNIAVIIDNEYTVVLKETDYFVYPNVANGTPCEDQSGIQPFIDFYEKGINDKKIEAERLAEEAKIAETKRIDDIKLRIEGCESPTELANEFGLKIVETAGHWSDLYEGRSSYAIMINSSDDNEIMEMAKDMLDVSGEFGELCNRAGEHHHTFNSCYSLKEYQKGLKLHFGGDKFFYRSQESEQESYLERIKEAEDIDDIKKLIKQFDEIEEGYYDCNGNLEMSSSDLESEELTGYSYDVYSYNFGFNFEFKYSFKKDDDNEEDDE